MKTKNKFLIFTVLLILLICTNTYAKELTTKLGDINLDGIINKKDADLLMKYLAGHDINFTQAQEMAADVNSDGIINGKDATRILQIIEASKYKAGDVNLDGVIDENDSDLLMKYLAEHDVNLTPVQKIIADVNSDGTINGKDATRLLKIIRTDRLQIRKKGLK